MSGGPPGVVRRRGPLGPRLRRPRGRSAAAPRSPGGPEHRTAQVPRDDRRRRTPRRNRDHLLEPRRRRHAGLHLPRGRVRPLGRGGRDRLQRIQRAAVLLQRDELHADRGRPRGAVHADRRHRPGARQDDARPERRGQQGQPADHRHGAERIARGSVRAPHHDRRAVRRRRRSGARRGIRERPRRRGPERDGRAGPHALLRHDEPDARPRHRRGYRAGRGQGRVRAGSDPLHGPPPRAGRVQRDRVDQPNPRVERRRRRRRRRLLRPSGAGPPARHRGAPP